MSDVGTALPLTPSQTVGPFLHIALPWPDGPDVVPDGTPGAIRLVGRVVDGAGEPVGDALIETWQADPDGRFVHPDDPRGDSPARAEGFRGFGRVPTGGGRDLRDPDPSARDRFRHPAGSGRRRISTSASSPAGCSTGS